MTEQPEPTGEPAPRPGHHEPPGPGAAAGEASRSGPQPREGGAAPREGGPAPREGGPAPREGGPAPREGGPPQQGPPPRTAGQPHEAAPPRQAHPRPRASSGGQPSQGSKASSRGQSSPSRQLGSDLTGEVQRWLIRYGARSMRREFSEQVRRTVGRGGSRDEPGNVWEAATTEPPPDETMDAPECAWCPICRAARRIRESGPGLGSQLAGAGDAVAAAVQEALAAFDAVLSGGPGSPAAKRGTTGASPAGPARPSPHEAERSGEGRRSEPDDRG